MKTEISSSSTPPPSAGYGIAAVERDTGIGKDTLRVWERRYGFPQPERDILGERVYPPDQIERLRLIKRLMDHGQRPGKLIPQSMSELQQCLEKMPSSLMKVGAGETAANWLIDLLRAGNTEALRQELAQRLARDGLRQFVVDTLPELNHRIGDAWVAGEIGVFDEHLYTELVQNQLRTAVHALPRPLARPQVLLTTLKDEEHLLGLLMVEALLCAEGVWCLSLGAQTPVSDIIGAARATTTDLVALSFSSAYPWRKARDALLELRRELPEHIDIWVGGGSLARHARHLTNIRCFNSLEQIPAAVEEWRQSHPL